MHLDAKTYADDKKTTGRAYAHVTGTPWYFGEADTSSVSCWGDNCNKDSGKKGDRKLLMAGRQVDNESERQKKLPVKHQAPPKAHPPAPKNSESLS